MDRNELYRMLDITAVIAGCVFIGCKAGRVLLRKYIKQAKHMK